MLYDDNTASQTYELYGPKEYSTEEISAMVDREIYKKRRHMNVPKALLKPIAEIVNRVVWWPLISADEVEREFINQEIDKTAKTYKDLGIEPGDISNFTYHYLVRDPSCCLHPLLSGSHIDPQCSKDSGAPPITTFRPRARRR